MAQLLNIVFKKNDLYSSWGFQVCGGRDSWRPLTVRSVQSGTLAYNYLNVGDRVLEIDGIDCYSLTESQAISFLRRSSNSIELLILKRRGENVVPPKRSSSCKALKNFSFPIPQSISEPCSPCRPVNNNVQEVVSPEKKIYAYNDSNESRKQYVKEPSKNLSSAPVKIHNGASQFSNFRPRRNSLQKEGEQICLRSRSSSPQFWKSSVETSATGPSSDCKSFWKTLEKCSMEDLSARRTPSPVRPASVAFYPKTPEPVIQPKTDTISQKKKVTFSNILLERNYLQTDFPDLSPGSKVDEEFNKIFNSSNQEERHQMGANNLAGDMSVPPPPAPPPLLSGGTAQGGPPPPPPPPMMHSGHIPAIRIKTELNEPRQIPSTIQNAMATKDKKPFTYLPGGLDLSEIRSPRMQRRLERNAQTPPSPEQVPQKSPEYPQQQVKPNFEQKPVCNVRPSSVCLLPQPQHQPVLNKAPTPWMQKAAQIQPTPAPWVQNKKEYVDQVDKSEERVVPMKIEVNRQVPSQPIKNNVNHSYDSEPIQGRSFKVLQQITEPKSIYDGSQPYNSQTLPTSELRKLQLNDDDRSFMNRVKSQANMDSENPRYRGGSIPSKIFKVLDDSVDDDKFLHNETDPRYRGASIPSRSFRMLQTLTNSAPVPMDNNKQSVPVNRFVSEPIESKIYVPPSERPVGTDPHKYTGSSIPSRSFRMLQAMTGQNNEEEDENDLRNRSLTPYPFLCPEFWEHYNYLKDFHDWHTGAVRSQQQHQQKQPFLQQQQQQQQQQPIQLQLQSQQKQNDASSMDTGAYTAHVLNTIDEEETTEEDSGPWKAAEGSDSECEVTVTIALPASRPKETEVRAAQETGANAGENGVEETAAGSPVDFWQQINDNGGGGGNGVERERPPQTAAAVAEIPSPDAESSEDATCDPDAESSEDATCASDGESSEGSSSDSEDSTSSSSSGSSTTTTSSTSSESSEDATPSPSPSPADAAVEVEAMDHGGGDGRKGAEEDADSGITTTCWSADVSRQTSEKEVVPQNGGGGGRAKKYQRACTHSRLFDFLRTDEQEDEKDYCYIDNNETLPPRLLLHSCATDSLQLSSCTSGYSSAATTPSSPSVGGRGARYESDSARAEYDNYYKSWDDACPYFGYDILPSKAFKTILHQQAGSPTSAVTRKFKCPKIPTTSENES